MAETSKFEIFLVAVPGLEAPLLQEAQAAGFAGAEAVPGGVAFQGGWPEVWRANLVLRGPSRVLARIGEFRAFHLAQLDKRARKFLWGDSLRADVPVKVEVTCRASKIYHAGAAAQRIETALREEMGVQIAADASVRLKVRIDDNLVILSVDTSGEGLHKRGHKQAIGKAPMRETLAALFLRQCGFDGSEPLLDPMCGSGTFVIEAAEIASGLLPGRSRRFAFEDLARFDADAFAAMKTAPSGGVPDLRFFGHDRDAGAVRMATENAARAGVAECTTFTAGQVSDLVPPESPPGLIMVNPPYGGRIGNKKLLFGVYAALGERLKTQFSGWRVGMVTSEPSLAKAAGLPFRPAGPPVPHGGLKIRLYHTGPLR
ncbi:THUMP domain-containing class I SAM-dependent RNA methyltransferase [Thalassococcus sp. BH17M4-6]|uniref:THUMP domain-containing class I SAM-dependent RNA methyltransferase n=1 Tax=Thalassococcus sp. BH17M4-6 TaxID=3413148 RepID=UPI003BE8FC40